ncbi:hypothetical protein [Pseudomonas azerbaijanoccidentalis]|jgi:hypothetical protein
MKLVEISIIVDGQKETATFLCGEARSTIVFSRKNGFSKKYESQDLYLCLAKIRAEWPNIKFLCKGSKLNVTPSRMCSQMSGGSVAYELKIGEPATFDDIVQIFDHEETDIVFTLEEQQDFYRKWLLSLSRE